VASAAADARRRSISKTKKSLKYCSQKERWNWPVCQKIKNSFFPDRATQASYPGWDPWLAALLAGFVQFRRTSKLEILLHKNSTMSSENDETCLEKVMWCQFGDMGSLNLKWRLRPDGPNCGGVNQNWFGTIQDYISCLLLHAQSFKKEIRRQGLCLEGNSGDEMERHIAEHCIERN
jgi:hypothetical protein